MSAFIRASQCSDIAAKPKSNMAVSSRASSNRAISIASRASSLVFSRNRSASRASGSMASNERTGVASKGRVACPVPAPISKQSLRASSLHFARNQTNRSAG